jgi:hypothetical protein
MNLVLVAFLVVAQVTVLMFVAVDVSVKLLVNGGRLVLL